MITILICLSIINFFGLVAIARKMNELVEFYKSVVELCQTTIKLCHNVSSNQKALLELLKRWPR